MRRRTPAVLVALLALPLLTSCGDTIRAEANPDTAKPIPLKSVQPTVFSAKPTAKPTATGGTTAASASAEPSKAAALPGEVLVTPENTFEPAEITVKVGEKVTWKMSGPGFHTVTGGDGTVDPASPIGDKAMTDPSATHEVTFTKAGKYPYFCQPHLSLGMKGTVTVA